MLNRLSKKKYYSLENQIFEYNGDFISASQKVRKSMLESMGANNMPGMPGMDGKSNMPGIPNLEGLPDLDSIDI